jgi:prepilin-type N-terminal cleavage/methylation domain-containing protein
MKQNFLKRNKGFTLVETLVAISIFSISILGLLSILAAGVTNTTYDKNKMVASYLAQEGVEYMRNLRDTHVLYDTGGSSVGWNNFKTQVGLANNTICSNASGYGCYFDDSVVNFLNPNMPMESLGLVACSNATCSGAPLKYDSSTGKYGYGSGTNSSFIRQIKMSLINANEIKISSTVYWTQGTNSSSVTFSENLFEWVE